ncbi:MAG: zinc-dependent alcohol dehydrogenase [Spirochaetota bacterium]
MEAVVISGPRTAAVEEYPTPEIDEGQCLVRVHTSGVGPSDLDVFRGANPMQHYPRIPGSDAVGIVERCSGSLAPVRRVLIPQTLPCGKCAACRLSAPERCLSPGLLGRERDGGMRDWMTASAQELITLPDELDDHLAACVPDVAFALFALARAREGLEALPERGADGYVTIFGAGFLGLTTALAAAEQELRPIVVDVVEARLQFARSLGVRHTCNPLKDFVGDQVRWITRTRYTGAAVIASDDPQAALTAPAVLRPGARLVLTGRNRDALLPTVDLVDNSIEVTGATRNRRFTAEAAAFLLRQASVFSELISLRLEPASMPRAFELLTQEPKSYMKVVCRHQ